MPDPINGYSADEVAEIKQGILALGGIIPDHQFDVAVQLTQEQTADLMQTLRCPGCGRPYAELPVGHTWRAGEECRDA